jgi:hypothetical protein
MKKINIDKLREEKCLNVIEEQKQISEKNNTPLKISAECEEYHNPNSLGNDDSIMILSFVMCCSCCFLFLMTFSFMMMLK